MEAGVHLPGHPIRPAAGRIGCSWPLRADVIQRQSWALHLRDRRRLGSACPDSIDGNLAMASLRPRCLQHGPHVRGTPPLTERMMASKSGMSPLETPHQNAEGSTREARISQFRQHRSRFREGFKSYTSAIGTSWDVKPQSKRSGGLLTAILARDLQVGTTHRGRVLTGTIIESPLFTGNACCFLMDDLCGELVHVAVYNVPGMSWQLGERTFYKGRGIAIAEPFFKVHLDGSQGVRVDNAEDISSYDIPKEPAEWREKGNECFKAHRFQEAQMFYNKGWEALSETRQDLAVLLTERAICCFNTGDIKACAKLAGCAWHLNPSYKKAVHWLVEALKSLPEEPQSSTSKALSWFERPGLVTWERPVFRDGSMPFAGLGGGKRKVKTWQEVKEEAMALLLESRWAEAGGKFHEATAKHEGRAELAAMMSNMAAVGVETKDLKQALQCATVAALLPPATQALAGRVWIRRARALEGLGNPHAPHCLKGVDLPGVKEEEEELQKRWAAKEKVTAISSESTEEQYKQRESNHPSLQGNMAVIDKIAHIQERYAEGSAKTKREMEKQYGPTIKRQLEPFHWQFPKENGWPVTDPGDIALCQELLSSAYAYASSEPWFSAHNLRTGAAKFGPEAYQERWRSSEALTLLAKVMKAGILASGTVICAKESMPEDPKYSSLLRNSFANNPPKRQILQKNTAHVAVGFNDLSLLLQCELLGAPSDRQGPGPLRFVGFDASPFSVAKSLVVAEMLRRGGGKGAKEVPIQHCLQVWFSSGWSAKASANFKACAAALATSPGAETHSAAVQSYLHHWASAADVPLPEARHKWLKTRDTVRSLGMAQFKRHEDRMAMCSYVLTGDVLGEGQTAEVGSMAMWSVPQGSPPLEDGEHVMQAVDLNVLAQRSSGGDVMEEACGMLSEQLQQVRGWLTGGDLEIELHCAFVGPGAPEVKEIQAMQPWTMSWSNVLDYMAPSRFHQLARECSKDAETIHFGYSMNWITEVYGTCMMDYDDLKTRAQIIKNTREAFARYQAANPTSRLLVSPPHQPIGDTAGFMLASPYREKWTDHFFNKKYTGGGAEVIDMDTAPFNPFSRIYRVMCLTWSYEWMNSPIIML